MSRRGDRDDDWQRSDLARITFLGAAGEVTGAKFLVETRRARVLVECGMTQGGRDADALNAARWPFDVAALDAVVLTHAHIDHSGLLPRLARDGYRGPIHATRGTLDLLRIMLPDAAWIQEHDTERANRRRGRELPPLEPLYRRADADRALELVVPHEPGEPFAVAEDLRVRLRRVGHILGAACVELFVRDEVAERLVVFSGDVGRPNDALLRDPEVPESADLVVMESTYGDRNHRSMEATREELVGILEGAARDGGNVLVPVFAVGRAQELVYTIAELEQQGAVTPRRVFLDSPMAVDVTALYRAHLRSLREETGRRIEGGADLLRSRHFAQCTTPQESMAINHERGVIVLAASGMCTGGRILFHLEQHLGRAETRLVIVGFQAEGTLGRALVDGARRVRVMGREIDVRASVHTVGGFSAHADRDGLLEWYGGIAARGGAAHPPLVLVHGEPRAQQALAATVAERCGTAPLVPARGDVLVLPRSGNPGALRAAAATR